MASAAHNCDICDLRHVTKPSVSWCSECDEGFCSDCGEHHRLAKATRHHKTMPIDDYQTLPQEVLQIPQSCTKHDEKFILYCRDHELPCCGKCAMEGHKGCSQVINIEDIVKNAKTSTSFQEIEEKLAEVVYNIKEIQNVYRGNITTFSENRKQIEKQIQVIRFKIDTHLNEIQDKLLDELKEVENAETKKVRQLVNTLEEKSINLTKYQNTIANIKHHSSDLQTFMFIRHTEEILSKEDEFTLSCLDGDNVNTGVITCFFDEFNKNFIESVHRFGKIVVEIKQTKAALRQGKKKQAQIIVPKLQTKTIENITAVIQQKIKTTSDDVRGCCILPDGRMVFTCCNTMKLVIVKPDGSKDFVIQLPGSAFGVTNGTTDNMVIVSSAFNKFGFSIINIQDRKVQKFITSESQCYGLVERNGDLIFCTNSELKMLNLHTETSKTITTAGVSEFSYVDADDRHIYYTSLHKVSLTCCDFHGVIKWTFDTQTLRSCLGISVDRNGFLHVLSAGSVVLITPCGKQSRKLLSHRDGINSAQVLYFDKTRDILLVANRKEKAFLYKVDLLVT